MNNHTFINKKLYELDTTESVSLLEHAVFKDRDGEKFVLFKFINNHSHELKELELEVTQLTADNIKIKSSVYRLNDLAVKGNDRFVPSSKFKLEDICESIECRIVDMVFDETKQEEDLKLIDLPLQKIKVGRRFPSVILPVLLSILLAYLVAVNLRNFYVKHTSNHKTFDYIQNHDDTITITKYNGTNRDVVIPNIYENKKVSKIADGAFKNTLIRSVRIEADDIIIGKEAFANAVLLRQVTGTSIHTIHEKAFRNNLLLKTFDVDHIKSVRRNAFYNAKSLKKIDVDNIVELEYQAFYKSGLKNYKFQDGLEIFNNVLINVAPNLKSLTLREKHKIRSIDTNAFNHSKYTLNELTIDIKDISFDKNVFADIEIKSLKLHPEIVLPEDALIHLQSSLEEIEMPVIGSRFKDIFPDSNIKWVKIVGTKDIPDHYFQYYSNVTEIHISPTIDKIGSNAFDQCYGLRVLSIPNLEESLSHYGYFPYLYELNVLKKDFKTTLVKDYINGFNELSSISFPNNITKTEDNVISNLPSLSEIEFPKTIEAINGALIGENCMNLQRVVIPFIGHDIITPMPYTELNRSHYFTKIVIVQKGFKIDQNTFPMLNGSIEQLTFEGKISGELEGSLRNLYGIQYLNMKQNDPKYVGSLFTTSPVNNDNEGSFLPPGLSTIILKGKRVK